MKLLPEFFLKTCKVTETVEKHETLQIQFVQKNESGNHEKTGKVMKITFCDLSQNEFLYTNKLLTRKFKKTIIF